MYARPLMTSFAMLVAVMTATASAQQPAISGAAPEGHRLALSKCDVCHLVARDQQPPPLIANWAPSFHDVADRPDMNAQTLEGFLTHDHSYEHMPYPDLTAAQVRDIGRRQRFPFSRRA